MITDISNIDNPVWQNRAACLKADPYLFFNRSGYRKAREICADCPVQKLCLDYHLKMEKKSVQARAGLVAGLTPAQRVKIIVCHYADCINRVDNYLDFCSPEHEAAHQNDLHENFLKSQRVPSPEYYKRGRYRAG